VVRLDPDGGRHVASQRRALLVPDDPSLGDLVDAKEVIDLVFSTPSLTSNA